MGLLGDGRSGEGSRWEGGMVDVHVDGVELVPGVVVVHAVFVVYGALGRSIIFQIQEEGRDCTARCHQSPSGSFFHLTMIPSQSCL